MHFGDKSQLIPPSRRQPVLNNITSIRYTVHLVHLKNIENGTSLRVYTGYCNVSQVSRKRWSTNLVYEQITDEIL